MPRTARTRKSGASLRDFRTRTSAGTNRGIRRARRENQDRFATPPYGFIAGLELVPADFDRKGTVYLVADGMGGEAAGDLASRIAVETMLRTYYTDDDTVIDRSLQNAFREANDAVYRHSLSDPSLQGMGTTLTAIVLHGDHLTMGHVGDTRVYRLRDGRLEQLSVDHTLVQQLIDEGVITQDKRRGHPEGNVLKRALGTQPVLLADFSTFGVQRGDRYLLTSDGAHDVLTDDQLLTALAADPKTTPETVIEMANAAGGPDNITALVVDLEAEPRRATGRLWRPLLAPAAALATVAALAALVSFGDVGGWIRGLFIEQGSVVVVDPTLVPSATIVVVPPTTAAPPAMRTPDDTRPVAGPTPSATTDTPPPPPTDRPTSIPTPTRPTGQPTVQATPTKVISLLSPADGSKQAGEVLFSWSQVSGVTNVKYELHAWTTVQGASSGAFKTEDKSSVYWCPGTPIAGRRFQANDQIYWQVRAIQDGSRTILAESNLGNFTWTGSCEEPPDGGGGGRSPLRPTDSAPSEPPTPDPPPGSTPSPPSAAGEVVDGPPHIRISSAARPSTNHTMSSGSRRAIDISNVESSSGALPQIKGYTILQDTPTATSGTPSPPPSTPGTATATEAPTEEPPATPSPPTQTPDPGATETPVTDTPSPTPDASAIPSVTPSPELPTYTPTGTDSATPEPSDTGVPSPTMTPTPGRHLIFLPWSRKGDTTWHHARPGARVARLDSCRAPRSASSGLVFAIQGNSVFRSADGMTWIEEHAFERAPQDLSVTDDCRSLHVATWGDGVWSGTTDTPSSGGRVWSQFLTGLGADRFLVTVTLADAWLVAGAGRAAGFSDGGVFYLQPDGEARWMRVAGPAVNVRSLETRAAAGSGGRTTVYVGSEGQVWSFTPPDGALTRVGGPFEGVVWSMLAKRPGEPGFGLQFIGAGRLGLLEYVADADVPYWRTAAGWDWPTAVVAALYRDQDRRLTYAGTTDYGLARQSDGASSGRAWMVEPRSASVSPPSTIYDIVVHNNRLIVATNDGIWSREIGP